MRRKRRKSIKRQKRTKAWDKKWKTGRKMAIKKSERGRREGEREKEMRLGISIACERKGELMRDSNRSDVEKETLPFLGIRNIRGRVGPHHWPYILGAPPWQAT